MNDSLLQQILAEQQRLTMMQQQQMNMQAQQPPASDVPDSAPPLTQQAVNLPPPPPIQNNYTQGPNVQVGVAQSAMSPAVPLVGGMIAGGGLAHTMTKALPAPAAAPTRDMINVALNDMMTTRSYRMGAEAQQDFYSDQRAQIQMGLMTAGEKMLNVGASAGTFLLPGGMLTSMVAGGAVSAGVGLVAGSMISGARDSLAYQDILREKGYKAFNVFESQNDFGGIGLNLDKQQDISKFLRETAPENFLEDEEVQKILSGALDGKLLKSSTDVDSFKKKFKEIVGVVKEMTVSMNASIEEVTAMMGELERRGVSVNQMGNVGAMAKLSGSFLGIGTQEAFQQMLETSDQLTSGNSLDASQAMKAAASNTFVTSQLTEQYAAESPEMKSYIKNNGGEAGVAADMTQRIAGALTNSPEVQNMAMTISAVGLEKGEDGVLRFNQDKLNQALASGDSPQELITRGTGSLQGMEGADLANYQQSFAEMSRSEMNQSQQAQVTQMAIKSFMDMTGATEETAAMRLGLASNQKDATVFMDQLNNLASPEVAQQMDAMAFREQMNATKIADSPTFMQRVKYGFRGMITEPLGNVGQDISDEIGDVSLDLQKFMSGVGDRSFTRSNNLVNPNDLKALQDQFDIDKKGSASNRLYEGMVTSMDLKKTDDLKETLADTMGVKFSEDTISRISGDRFANMVEQYGDGKLDPTAIAGLRDQIKSGKMDNLSEKRAMYIVDLAAGKNMAAHGSATNPREYGDFDTLAETTNAEKAEFGGSDKASTFAQILKQQESTQKELKKDAAKYDEQFQDALNKSKLSKEDTIAVQRAVRTKNYDAVSEITSDKGVLKSVDRLQELNKRTDAFSEAAGGLKDITAQVELTSSVPEYYEKMLISSGALSKDKANSLFGDLNDDAKQLKKDLKGKKLTIDEAIKAAKAQQEDGKAIMSTLSDEELTKLAQGVVDSSASDTITSIDNLMSNGTVDAKKVSDAIDSIAVASSKDAKKGSVDKDKSIDDSLSDHSDAMNKFLDTIVKETGTMKEANKAIKTGNFNWSSRM